MLACCLLPLLPRLQAAQQLLPGGAQSCRGRGLWPGPVARSVARAPVARSPVEAKISSYAVSASSAAEFCCFLLVCAYFVLCSRGSRNLFVTPIFMVYYLFHFRYINRVPPSRAAQMPPPLRPGKTNIYFCLCKYTRREI